MGGVVILELMSFGTQVIFVSSVSVFLQYGSEKCEHNNYLWNIYFVRNSNCVQDNGTIYYDYPCGLISQSPLNP